MTAVVRELDALWRLKRLDLTSSAGRRLVRRLTMPADRAIPVRQRSFPVAGGGAAEGTISGLASAYNHAYVIGHPLERELILPGAFATSIARQSSVPVMWSHAWEGGPVGTARVWESNQGLHFEARLFTGSDLGSRIYKSVDEGGLQAMSIGFVATKVRIRNDDDGGTTDMIEEGRLLEISVVLAGANDLAGITSTK